MRGKSKVFAFFVAILFAVSMFVIPTGARAATEGKSTMQTEQQKKAPAKKKTKSTKKAKATKKTAEKAKAKEDKPKTEKAK